jgi:integrase
LGLRLEHIDWREGVVKVHRPKTKVANELPLLPQVAQALAGYLRSARPPHAAARELFVRIAVPHPVLTSGGIRHRIRKYARQAGIDTRVLGAHILRHSHATRQIDIGANPTMVSEILGHRRPSSTSVYVRVALRRLRAIALPVPR